MWSVKLVSRIPNLWHCYQLALHLGEVNEQSALDISSQTASESGLGPAFPNDWAYLPILMLSDQAFNG
jgi:hypothetical protein